MKWSAIALAHGVSSTTLRDRVKGHGGGAPRGGGAGRPTVLPLAAELQLVEWVRLHQVGGKAVVAMCLKKEAKRLAGKHKRRFLGLDGLPGRDWLTSFLQRYKLSMRVPVVRAQGKEMSAELLGKVERWYLLYKEVLDTVCKEDGSTFSDNPHRILNFDESGCQRGAGDSRVVAATGEGRSNTLGVRRVLVGGRQAV